jgi:hypothetical protein
MSTGKREAEKAERAERRRSRVGVAPDPVGRAERCLVLAWALVMICAAAAPIVSGYLHARPGERFLGFVPAYYEDYQSYLAWMRQAEQGHLLFRDLFTSETHRRIILLPVFWVMGAAARLTGASLVGVWYLVHGLATVLLVWTIHAFAARFSGDRTTRLLALGLATTAAGLGGFVPASLLAGSAEVQRPIDLWMVEANQFFPVASSYFTLPLALALMLLALMRLLRHLEEGRSRDAGAAGGYAIALAMTHQYDVATLFAVVAAWVVVVRARHWRGLVLFAAIPAPYVVYSLAVVRLDPALSRLTWDMPVPGVSAHLLGWGIPLILAVGAALVPAVRRDNRNVPLLVAWLLAVVVLLLVPLEFRRKLIWGAQIPMAMLAAMGVRWVWGRIGARPASVRLRRALAGGAAVALLAVCAYGSFLVERDLLRRAAASGADEFVPQGFVEGLDWLRLHARPGDVVMASPSLAPLVPGWTGATVFAGHWAQTIDLDAKWHFVEMVFRSPGFASPGELRQVLDRNRVRFIVLDARAMSLVRLPDALPDRNIAGLATPVLRNQEVAIWEVEPPPSTSAEARWRSGDWMGP